MDSSIWIIVLFAIMAILSDKLGKKKPPQKMPRPFPPREEGSKLPPPMPSPWGTEQAKQKEGHISFEIPDIKGAPLPKGTTDEGVYREPGTKMQDMLETYREEMADRARAAAYEAKRQEEEAAIRAEEEAVYEEQAGLRKSAQSKSLLPHFTKEQLQHSIVMAELLGKPKAYRHHSPYWRR
jgi:hypothetical protein